MVEIICGGKGKGKTKFLLEKANDVCAKSDGAVVYLDKSSKHMFELDNKIRLINMREYPACSFDGVVGFICGLLSGNHDIDNLFFDNLLRVAGIEEDTAKISDFIKILESIGDNVNFYICISLDKSELPEDVLDKVTVAY